MLPKRHKPHRYRSSVDSLSSPELYIVRAAVAARAVAYTEEVASGERCTASVCIDRALPPSRVVAR